MTLFPSPGSDGSTVTVKSRYDNWIGGQWVAPVQGRYFENVTPVTGQVFCEIARSTAEDIELALDAGHGAAEAWGKTSATDRSGILLKIADRMEANLTDLAIAETWDNGTPPTWRWPSTTSATSPARSGPRRARSARSTRTPWRTTSTSRWAWSARSSPGTSRS